MYVKLLIAGHYHDESVVAVAVSEDNQHMITGDSQGIVRTWALKDILQDLIRGCRDGDVEEDAAVPVAQWRAHKGAVGSFAVIACRHDLMISCGADFNVSLWTHQGAHVGIFGQVHSLTHMCLEYVLLTIVFGRKNATRTAESLDTVRAINLEKSRSSAA